MSTAVPVGPRRYNLDRRGWIARARAAQQRGSPPRLHGRALAEAIDMTKLTLLSLLAFSLGACTIGDEGGGTGTGSSDFSFCQPTQIDSNGDGTPDGLDTNCDGVIDINYNAGGGQTGGTDKCSTMTSLNGQTEAMTCTSENGGAATCECRVNGTLQQTCTEPTARCSIGVPNANCCGF